MNHGSLGIWKQGNREAVKQGKEAGKHGSVARMNLGFFVPAINAYESTKWP